MKLSALYARMISRDGNFMVHQGGLLIGSYSDGYPPSQIGSNASGRLGVNTQISDHEITHSCRRDTLEGGADVRFIQAMLGHARLDTTQIYTQVSIRKLKEIHEATHPTKLQRAGVRAPLPEDEEEPTEQDLLASLAAEVAEEEEHVEV